MSGKGKFPWRNTFFGLIIGGAAMWWTLSGVPLDELWQHLTRVNWMWMAIVAAMFMGQQILRSCRQMLIIQARYPEHRFASSFAILCIGFFFINTLPARIGEAVRPILLKSEGVPIGNSIALLVAERTIDLCAALIMFALVLGYVDAGVLDNPIVQTAQSVVGLLLPALIIFLGLLIFKGNHLKKPLSWVLKFGPLKIFQGFVDDFIDSFAQLGGQRLFYIVMLTIVTWGLTGWMTIAGAAAFNLHEGLEFIDGIAILAFTMLGMAAPSAPGFAGAYEAAFILGCFSIGLKDIIAVTAFAFGFHWWIHLIQSISAIYFISTTPYSFKEIISSLKRSFSLKDKRKSVDLDQ